jgi:predicted DsbA family dithiol-disulfide isomerase
LPSRADTVAGVRIVEVFADVCCPFTHVGLRRLVARRRDFGRDDVVLRIRAWPLELVNGEPLDPDFVAEEIEALRGGVAPDLFAGFAPASFPRTSLPALALACDAYRRGDATGERISLALRTVLFEEGRNVAERAELTRIAATEGLEIPGPDAHKAVLDDLAEGRERGVIGSPHFFSGDEGFFCPALEIDRVDGHLRIREDKAGFSRFLERCVG